MGESEGSQGNSTNGVEKRNNLPESYLKLQKAMKPSALELAKRMAEIRQRMHGTAQRPSSPFGSNPLDQEASNDQGKVISQDVFKKAQEARKKKNVANSESES